jgi:glycosyltransferase involved in cell wall biosynthesis
VSSALDIPYVVAEASVAAKQRHGKWAMGYWESVAAVERASATIFFNPVDFAGVRTVRGAARDDEYIPPFLDLAGFADAVEMPGADVADRRKRVRLIAVAMMRPGAKLASYRLLADALALVPSPEWELVLVGDGTARGEVEAAFARFDAAQVRLVGFQDPPAVSSWLRSSDVYVWPAIDEAFGMAFIEAQACGLPVIAGAGGGVASVVAANRTGLLVPLGDAASFANAIEALITDDERRRRMAPDAVAYVTAQHDLPAAAARIDAVLRRAVAEQPSATGAKTASVPAR